MLEDAGESSTDFGQLAIAGAMFAEFGSIILLSLFFSPEATGTATKLVLLGGFALLAAGFAFVVLRLERSMRITAVLLRLQDTTAQIRVRGAFMLLVAFVALAAVLGLETILGAFVAGVILRLVDGDCMMTHPQFRQKLEAIGFGVFIPVFFITSGIQFDLAALFSSPSTILRVPIFLVALVLVRGVPALLYRPLECCYRFQCRHYVKKRAYPMIRKTFIETERGLVAQVTFILPNSTWADTIYLVGDFNGWNHSSHPFQRCREGTWTLTLDLEVGRCYQFRYRRDGEWINDSQADGFVGNLHDSDNSLVVTDPKFKRYSDERTERRGGQNPALEIDDP